MWFAIIDIRSSDILEFAYINPICHCGIVPVEITLHRLDVLNMEAKNIVVENSILDEIIMYAFSEEHFCGLCDFSLRLSVDLKTRCAGKSEELSLLEMPNNVLVHITKLTAVTLVDDEDNLLVLIGIHNLCILRTLHSVRHLLHRCDDELSVFVLHLFYKDISSISGINRTSFKFVELFCGLGVQVLPVYKEDDLFDIGIGCEDLCRLKRCQHFSCAGCMPNIGVAIGEGGLPDKSLYRIYLIGTHYHEQLVRVIQDGISRQHLDDMVSGKEGDRELFQIGDTHIVEVRPEEGKTVKHISVGVGKVFCIRKYKNPTEVSDLMFTELIDKIVVYESEGVGKARTQKVDIYFNYVGQVDIAYTEEELAEIKEQEEQVEKKRLEKQRQREKAYREKRKAKKLAENGGEIVKTKVCPHCQKEFIPTSNRQIFCSKDCCYQARQDKTKADREAEKGNHYYRQRVCAVCGSTYWPTHSQQKFCSAECKKVNHNKKTLEFYYKKQKDSSRWLNLPVFNISIASSHKCRASSSVFG